MLQFVPTLSSDAQNVVISLVRYKVAAEKAFREAVPKNLSFLDAEITDLDALKVNVMGVINTVNASVPLLRKGREKRVPTLSTGMADIDLINQVDVAVAAPYSISKGALDVAVAKYSALYNKSESICPWLSLRASWTQEKGRFQVSGCDQCSMSDYGREEDLPVEFTDEDALELASNAQIEEFFADFAASEKDESRCYHRQLWKYSGQHALIV
ncbi:MAG: hypothetical protein Q9175_004378 [Cornicularia normoerica]